MSIVCLYSPFGLMQSGSANARCREQVRSSLQGVSAWFDEYLGGEQGDGLDQVLLPLHYFVYVAREHVYAELCG